MPLHDGRNRYIGMWNLNMPRVYKGRCVSAKGSKSSLSTLLIMTWQGYIDQSLLGSGNVTQAAMYSLNGDCLATSPDFQVRHVIFTYPSRQIGTTILICFGVQLSATEVQEIVNGFDDSSPLYSKGMSVNGVNYAVIYATDRSIYGRKVKCMTLREKKSKTLTWVAVQKASGVCLVKTKQCLLVGVYTEGIQNGDCVKTVEKLADYLISVNYVS